MSVGEWDDFLRPIKVTFITGMNSNVYLLWLSIEGWKLRGKKG
jgi:hypothetical protein